MYPADNISVTNGERRRGLLLCALLILISQLFLQLHPIVHVSDADNETCEICLAGRALEHAVANTVPHVCVKSDDKAALPVPVIDANSTCHLSFQSRAPPLRHTNV